MTTNIHSIVSLFYKFLSPQIKFEKHIDIILDKMEKADTTVPLEQIVIKEGTPIFGSRATAPKLPTIQPFSLSS